MTRSSHFDSLNNYVALYGLMQKAIKASDSEKSETTAKELLEENGVATTITAECIGNPKLITGNAALVERYYARMWRSPTSGNPDHYQMWAGEVDGVGYARVIAKWDGDGTVKVLLASTQSGP